MIDPLVVKAWAYEAGDNIILNLPTCAIFQKPSGEIRIIEHGEMQVVNRLPMFLEEVLIRELISYKQEKTLKDEEVLD